MIFFIEFIDKQERKNLTLTQKERATNHLSHTSNYFS